jgi:polar amino acid transport system ATP-binding protein
MLKVNNITRKYHVDKDHRGIFDVSFSVEQGEVICILGQSGSGKTTLLRMLAGLEGLDSGTMNLAEDSLASYVAQDYTLWPHLTVLENLSLAPTLKGQDQQKIADEARSLLERFSLEEYASSYPAELSGGQRQRIALLRAIMVHPKILLLDEITSALDPVLVNSVLELIKTLAKENYTMIIVTHHMSLASSIADRIIFLKDGSVLQDTNADTFFNRQDNPEIQSFIQDFKKKDIHEHIS